MTSLMFGHLSGVGVPADQETVRSTTAIVSHDTPAAEQTDMPEANEFESDSNPDLGLAQRQLASHWVEGQTATPPSGVVAQQNVSNQMIAAQVSTSGTAADREASGQTHKNLSYAVGIEPVFDLGDPNHKFGNTYFVRNSRDIQEGAGDYMTVPPGRDHAMQGEVAAYGKTAARDAAQSALYNSWWNGGSNG